MFCGFGGACVEPATAAYSWYRDSAVALLVCTIGRPLAVCVLHYRITYLVQLFLWPGSLALSLARLSRDDVLLQGE